MKLAIILVVYIALCAIALVTLWGPLRRAIDPERDHRWRSIAIAVVFIVLLAIPVLGALAPGDPVGFELQAAGNVILGYIMFFSGVLLIVRVIGFFAIGIPRRRRDGKRWTPARKTSAATLLAVLVAGRGPRAATVEVDGVRGADVPVSGDLFYPLYTAVGAEKGSEFYVGKMKRIRIEPR